MEGFQCLPVAFAGSTCSSQHTIYCKKHAVRQNAEHTPNNRTLFTLGWPPYSKAKAIEELFSRAGQVTAVYLQPSPGSVNPSRSRDTGGFRVGYVVFASESDVDSALRLSRTPVPITCGIAPVGLGKWSRQYLHRRPTRTALERQAEVGVALYDRQREAAEKERVKEGKPDEDGWIKVPRKTHRVAMVSCVQWSVCVQ